MARRIVLDVIRDAASSGVTGPESAKPVAFAAAGSLLLLDGAACSSNPGTPVPATPELSSAPTSTAHNVPKVSNPVDAAKYQQNPCALLSQGKGLVAPICTWYNADSESGYFEAAPDVNGYPAVFAGTTDARKRGGCQIAVGSKDDETFTASVLLDKSFRGYTDPCALAAKTGAAAVTTLKAGA